MSFEIIQSQSQSQSGAKKAKLENISQSHKTFNETTNSTSSALISFCKQNALKDDKISRMDNDGPVEGLLC